MCSFIVDILQFSLKLKYSGVRSDLSLEDDELVQHFSRSSQLRYTSFRQGNTIFGFLHSAC
jgi:hypothetical protein